MEINVNIWGTGNAWSALFPHRDAPQGNASVSLTGRRNDNTTLHMVVDTGAGCSSGIHEAALPPPQVILLTHLHPDHLNQMEVDTLIRMARNQMRPPIRVVATETTWEQVGAFNRKRLDWIPAMPGAPLNLEVAGETVEILPLSAADHHKGGVVYVISAGSYRVGILFDKRNWDNIGTEIENLDLAIMEANSVQRLADKTRHVSLLDDIDLIRRLERPPRMTVFTHYGTDDEEVQTIGSLCAQLHALAPGIASCWAYPGMMIAGQSLPPRNPVAVIEPDSNRLAGVKQKSVVHAEGFLHASVLTLVCDAENRLVVYERHARQSYPGCLDLLGGGHMEPGDLSDPRRTAAREASEEILLTKEGLRVMIDPDWIRPLSVPFSLVSTDPSNNERSSVFGLRLPAGVEVGGSELTDQGEPVDLKVKTMTLQRLLTLHRRAPTKIADGLSRVLSEIGSNIKFQRRVKSFLEDKHA